MQLLYLYIPKYGILEDVEINFTGKYQFKFDKEKRELKQLPSKADIDEDFFSLGKENGPVKAVSAIVGNNGSGKTSVATLLSHILNCKVDFVIIYKYEGKICWSKRWPLINGMIPVITGTKKFDLVAIVDLKVLFVYSSLFYSPHHIDLNVGKTRDFSTSFLIKSEHNSNVLTKISTIHKRKDATKRHVSNELIRILKFINESAYYNLNPVLKYPLPSKIQIHINEIEFSLFELKVEKERIENRVASSIIAVARKCVTSRNFLLKLIGAFWINHFNYLIDTYFTHGMNDQSFNEILIDLNKSCELNDNQFIQNFVYACKILDKKEFKNQTFDIKVNLKHFRYFGFLIKILRKRVNRYFLINDTYIEVEIEKIDMVKFANILSLYFITAQIKHYLEFKFDPFLSSGELAQLSIYSRLFSIKKDKRVGVLPDNVKTKDFIFFFDEIEITIHPSLQKQLVTNMITFFETFFPDTKVHLIFATHSPILLSDIPKSNTVLLERYTDEEDKKEKVRVREDEPETFGANIHSLYKNSFLMGDGLIGGFAERKIKDLIEELTTKDQFSEDDKSRFLKLINMIGEPVIKSKLKNLFDEKTGAKQLTPEDEIELLKARIEELEALKEESHD